MLGIPLGIHELADVPGRSEMSVEPKSLNLLDFRHKKRRPWTSLDVEVVEPGGFEPPSASTPLSVLHA